MASKAEVKTRALELLGLIRVGQSSQSQDDARIETAYTEVYEDLKTEGLAVWATSGTIPNDIAPHLIALMALNGTDSYGVSDARYQRILLKAGQNGSVAKREIRSLATPDYESLEEMTDF